MHVPYTTLVTMLARLFAPVHTIQVMPVHALQHILVTMHVLHTTLAIMRVHTIILVTMRVLYTTLVTMRVLYTTLVTMRVLHTILETILVQVLYSILVFLPDLRMSIYHTTALCQLLVIRHLMVLLGLVMMTTVAGIW